MRKEETGDEKKKCHVLLLHYLFKSCYTLVTLLYSLVTVLLHPLVLSRIGSSLTPM